MKEKTKINIMFCGGLICFLIGLIGEIADKDWLSAVWIVNAMMWCAAWRLAKE